MSAVRTISLLLVCQAFSPLAAEKSRLVRTSVSATGNIMANEQDSVEGEMAVSATGEIEAIRTEQVHIAPNGDIMDGSLMEDEENGEGNEYVGEELLAQVESIFEKEELDKQDVDQINVIKDLIDKEILPDLHKTRDAAQAIIDSNLKAIDKCNADSDKRQTDIKGKTEATTESARTDHAACRTEEENKNNTKNGRCGQLDAFLDAVKVPESIPAGRARDSMVNYVSTMSGYFCPKGPEVEKLDEACTEAEAKHAKHQAACNKKQATFELAFCTWRTELVDACANLDTCYGDMVKAWKDHVKATNVLVAKWKTEFKALHKIKCYTDVWLNNNDQKTVDAAQYEKCKETEKDDSVMDVKPGNPSAKQTCDLKPVETHPGTAKFPEAEYSKFANFAVSPIPCLKQVKMLPVTEVTPISVTPISGSNNNGPTKISIPTLPPATTQPPTTTTGELVEAKTTQGWEKVHHCTHCGNRGTTWKHGKADEHACGTHCDTLNKPLLIYNSAYKTCRCYTHTECKEDNRVSANSANCKHHVYGNGNL